MLVDKPDHLEVEGNLQGTKVAMTIDAEATVHLMGVLTNLYSDPEGAVVREYPTNAMDSHVAAGQTRPIEITLPSALSPFFKVKDYGVGLSVEEIHSIYSQYGRSTKRDSNEAVGMLGLGCKSALAYCQQFTLTAVKDGTRIQVAISREEDGTGSMTVVDTSATDDPNGVEVVIPVKQGSQIAAKAQQFFRFWAKGTVLLNGEEPKPVTGLKITDSLMLAEDLQQPHIVMGNVAYPINSAHYDGYSVGHGYGRALVKTVPIGAVNFTPAREELMYTDKTKRVIAEMKAEYADNIVRVVEEFIEKQDTPAEALKEMLRLRNLIPSGKRPNFYNYRGKQMPTTFSPLPEPKPGEEAEKMVVVPPHDDKLSAHQRIRSTNIESVQNCIIFHGYDRASFTAGQKKKINEWRKANDIGYPTHGYILLKDKPDTYWLEDAKLFPWEPVQATKIPRNAPGPSGRIPGSYDVWLGEVKRVGYPADDIDQDNPVFYYVGNADRDAAAILAMEYDDEFTIVEFNYTREAKFLRNFPKAKEMMPEVRRIVQAWVDKNVLPADRLAMKLHSYYWSGNLSKLDATKIKDPSIKKWAKVYERDLSKVNEGMKAFGRYATRIHADEDIRDPFDRYPLFDSSYRANAKHNYLYLNAAYDAFYAAADKQASA